MVKVEKVRCFSRETAARSDLFSGGKVKPLKAPKKEKKEMDEEDVAFKAKQAAGATNLFSILVDDD